MNYEEILALMQESYRELTGFDADSASDIGIRLRVLAEQCAALYGQVDELNRQAFPQTSTGESLERHAECRGLYRKPARQAEGALRFSRALPAQQDTLIAAGTLCATGPEPQLQFETTADVVLRAGEVSVEAPARAVAPGESGNAAAGAVRLMISSATGVTGVANSAPFTGGTDEEDDEALRSRLLDAFRNISNGANAAFYYDIAMGHESVTSAAVLPRARGRGTVDVAIHCSGGESDALDTLQAEFELRREVGVDVDVYPATIRAVDLTVHLAASTGSDFDAVAASCAEAVREEVGALGVGEPLLIARLTATLLALDGVYNVSVRSPQSDVFPDAATVLRPGSVAVERLVMG